MFASSTFPTATLRHARSARFRGAPELRRNLLRPLPGVALCLAVTAAAYAGQRLELLVFGQPYLEALVLAILLGTAVRTLWTPPAGWHHGIEVSAKLLLEVAVLLLGASVSLPAVAAAGPLLLLGVAGVVVAALATSYVTGRVLGLPPRMAILVACGNSICGNSAIAAVAPVIGAHAEDVASSIAFTAILGVLVVLGLPLLVPLLGLSAYGYGVLAGLTVYAVPQVLAATAPVGALAMQVGTLVKLVRVLMLGPVVLALSVGAGELAAPHAAGAARHLPPLHRLVPWFIVGFLGLATLRSLSLVPEVALPPIGTVATLLTVVSMAALGLGVDVRVLGRVGFRAIAAVTLSLGLLLALSFGLIRLLGVA
jgi:uncharacterized integral membrane protein (TIGR00698 family)